MKKIVMATACGVALLAASCEKDPDYGQLDSDLMVYTDYDSNTVFQNFETYFLPDSILETDGVHASYWKDDNAKLIIGEVENQMNSLGYQRITDPERKDEADVGIQLSYTAKTTVVTGIYGGGYGGWWDYGFWGPWWNGWAYAYPVTYSYNTNTLVMEMVDLTAGQEDETARRQLPVVWYASASGFMYGNGRVNLQLLLNGVDQAFTQSTYLTNTAYK